MLKRCEAAVLGAGGGDVWAALKEIEIRTKATNWKERIGTSQEVDEGNQKRKAETRPALLARKIVDRHRIFK